MIQPGSCLDRRSPTPQQDFGELSRAATDNAPAPGFTMTEKPAAIAETVTVEFPRVLYNVTR